MTIQEILNHLGIPFRRHGEHYHVSSGWVGIDCVHCSPGSGKFHLGINLHSLRASCWRCGTFRLGTLLAEASGQHISEILKLLPGVEEDLTREKPKPRGKYTPPEGVGPLLAAHRRYLEKRGFDPDEIACVWGVEGIGLQGAYKWRLFLPITIQKQPISWTTRKLNDLPTSQRYLAAPPEAEEVPIHNCLYGLDYVKHAVVIVEGPTDAWRIGPGSVATFGLGVSPAQICAISKIPVRVVCFDNESRAQARARFLADTLEIFPGETSVVQLSGKDPATSPPDEITELRRRFLS